MRALNRLASLLLGLALIAGGALATVEAVLVIADRPPWLLPADRIYAELTTTRLGDDVVLLVAVITAVVGGFLLIAQLWPGPPRRVKLRPTGTDAPDDDTVAARWWLARRDGEAWLGTVVEAVPGVGRPRVRLRTRRGRWKVAVTARARADQREAIEARLDGQIERLAAPPGAEVRLRIRPPRTVA